MTPGFKAFVGSLIGGAFLLLMATISAKEAHNQETVTKYVGLCSRSGCNPCGKFYYVRDGVVEYDRSSCEVLFQVSEEEAAHAAEDAEIRSRYLDGGK